MWKFTDAVFPALNHWGDPFCRFAWAMMIQAGVLVAVLLVLDLLFKTKVRAIVRYWLWSLVLVKLLLPVDLKTPVSLAYWLPRLNPSGVPASTEAVQNSPPLATNTVAVAPLDQVPANAAGPAVPISVEAVALQSSSAENQVAANSSIAQNESIRGNAIIFIVWLATVAVLLAAVWRRATKVRRLVNNANDASADLQSLLVECQTPAERARRSIRLKVTDQLGSPAIAGFWKATILLPNRLISQLDSQQLRLVFAHELTHWRRGDLQIHCLQTALQILYFYSPPVWIANAVIRRLREQAVDETVLATRRTEADRYGATLLDIAAGMLQPAESMLRLIGVVESRKALAGRIKRLVSLPIPRTAKLGFAGMLAVALVAVTLLPMAGNHSSASAEPSSAAQEKATISGVVHNEQGEPLPGAMVYVYSAGVREGTSPYCPTCYADCGKRALTDAEGKFAIESLDPTLVFRLLVAAKDYRPHSIVKVDPQQAKPVEAKLIGRPLPVDSKCIVQGQVVNPLGNPAAGAIVEPFGCKKGERRWWGSMAGVDPLAVTDENGKFAIVCDEPVVGLDLKVECRGAAKKNFELISSGIDEHRLPLEAGSSVVGRVLHEGRPVEGVLMGIVQAERRPENFVGPETIATDKSGRFTFSNLPPGDELVIYGIMDSLRDRGSILAKKITPGADKPLDVGDINLSSACRLKGRIVLSDGKPLPPRTRVLISRDEAWDTQKIEVDADGKFEADGVPAEYISINAMIRDYHLSDKNKSFEPLNATSIQGVVDGDIDDLIVLFEPGALKRPQSRDQSQFQVIVEQRKRLRSQRISGVTSDLEAPKPEPVQHAPAVTRKPLPKIEIPPKQSAPASTDDPKQQKTISGVVVDATGKAVPNAQVWLPCQFLSPFESLTVSTKCDDQGKFRLSVPLTWLPSDIVRRNPHIWAYKPGYALGTFNAYKQLFDGKTDECRLELPAASNIDFVVLSPDWKPIQGAKVEPEHYRNEQGNYGLIPKEILPIVSASTDEKGRVSLSAMIREKMLYLVVDHKDYGRQRFRVDHKDTENAKNELILREVTRIEGQVAADQVELTRGMFLYAETEDTFGPTEPQSPTGIALLKVDEQGRFVAPAIASGRLNLLAQCDERLPVRPRLPEQNEITLLEGETAKIEIPLEMTVPVRGVLRAKDTKEPIVGATVSVRYGVGRQGEHALTDENGVYRAKVLSGNVYTQVISFGDSDYVQLGEPWAQKIEVPEGAEEFELPTIEASPIKTVEGKLLDRAGKPLANTDINGIVGNRRYGFGKSDKNGDFSLSHIPMEVDIEHFQVWQNDEPSRCVVDSTEPLVVRIAPQTAKP